MWLVEDKSARSGSGIAAAAVGHLVWERSAGHDSENPDPSLRGRPTLGIPILLGMRPAPEPQAPDGPPRSGADRSTTPTNGQTYEASIKPLGPDVLHLEGCVLGGLFCGGQDWTRVKAPAAAGRQSGRHICSRIPDLARGAH